MEPWTLWIILKTRFQEKKKYVTIFSHTLFPHKISVWSIHRALNRVVIRSPRLEKEDRRQKKKKKRSPPLPLPFFFRIVSSSSPLLERPPRTNMTDFCDLPPPNACTFMRFYTSSTSSPRAYYPTGKFPMARFPRVMRFFIPADPNLHLFTLSPTAPPVPVPSLLPA